MDIKLKLVKLPDLPVLHYKSIVVEYIFDMFPTILDRKIINGYVVTIETENRNFIKIQTVNFEEVKKGIFVSDDLILKIKGEK